MCSGDSGGSGFLTKGGGGALLKGSQNCRAGWEWDRSRTADGIGVSSLAQGPVVIRARGGISRPATLFLLGVAGLR